MATITKPAKNVGAKPNAGNTGKKIAANTKSANAGAKRAGARAK